MAKKSTSVFEAPAVAAALRARSELAAALEKADNEVRDIKSELRKSTTSHATGLLAVAQRLVRGEPLPPDRVALIDRLRDAERRAELLGAAMREQAQEFEDAKSAAALPLLRERFGPARAAIRAKQIELLRELQDLNAKDARISEEMSEAGLSPTAHLAEPEALPGVGGLLALVKQRDQIRRR